MLYISHNIVGLNLSENLDKSVSDRLDQYKIWNSVILQNNLFFYGKGAGNYMFHVELLFPNLDLWQYQPVHNVFLIILGEIGIIGFFLFASFIWKLAQLVNNVSRETLYIISIRGIFCGLILIMLFDHYLWDIQQGQIIFWLTLGILIGSSKKSQTQMVNKLLINRQIYFS